ncbi:putative n-acylsphingosine amidohydrolase protein [Rosellinia necatrix]|uniref:ceramidase n=1 Tax=Rosellinia necatrix TaxID=77044 RepID=A0A1S8A7H3_ROSNE|nr:putative n-acylsphingosine amidohydrolase protein [Rosellinia necatrix]
MSTSVSTLEPIPRFTIDLARPPRERYDEVVRVFGPRMRSLAGLFDTILSKVIISPWVRSTAGVLSKLCLRRVYDKEENEEIRGISAASGVPLYLLVALNNLLDCLLGCTSGAAPVKPTITWENTGDGASQDCTRLLHFRTLDWTIHGLRELLVVLEFVDSSSDDRSQVIARSITYARFVGCLTGVRPGLSISLNQRPCHDGPSRQLHWHQLLVLLGRRRSVASIVRSLLFQPYQQLDQTEYPGEGAVSKFVEHASSLAAVPCAPCYLILCDGQEAVVIVKDHVNGTVQSTREFIAQTNHDPYHHAERTVQNQRISRQDRHEALASAFAGEGWAEESVDRLQCLQQKWDRLVPSLQARSSKTLVMAKPSITERTLRKWICDYPTLNEYSHFVTILDPMAGTIRWLIRGLPKDL